jgi:glycosyl hydrolase family 16
LSDLRHLPPTDELPIGRSSRRVSSRTVVLIAGLVAVALVATLVFVLVRPGGGGAGPGDGSTPPSPPPLAGEDTSAGKLLGWGEPSVTETFDKPLDLQAWNVYDSVGHGNRGRRSPDQVNVKDGMLVIDGDPKGSTGGLALADGQMYGRWEGRVRAPASDETYHALLLLWPDAENWPAGGEVDFMEMTDPQRQDTNMFVHYSEDGKQDQKDHGEVRADGTQWHNWAVEWTPEHIIAYLDGREWFRTVDPKTQPPGPMHLAIQLDWFPSQGDENDVKPSSMDVDWVKQYPYPAK